MVETDRIIFNAPGQGKPLAGTVIERDAVRWYSLRRSGTHEENVPLTIHCELDDDWTVHAFGLSQAALTEFYRTLMQVDPAAPLARYPDYGPERVPSWTQDIYGAWQNEALGALYLAPDRVLYRWDTALLYSQISQIMVTSIVQLPATDHLLRIEYRLPDDPELHVIGFSTLEDRVEHWAHALHTRSGAPLEIRVGRKKK